MTAHKRRISVALAIGVMTTGAMAVLTPTSSAQGDTPGTRPAEHRLAATAADPVDGLQLLVNERGRISQSTSGLGTSASSGNLRVRKPAGATVRGAWLGYATRGFSGYQVVAPLTLGGQPVPITNELRNGIDSYNYFADVTDIVKPLVDGAVAGDLLVPVSEPDSYYVEGTMLVVVFDDPAVTEDQSVTLLYGALAPTGDRYRVTLAEPIDLSDPATRLEMSLGTTFSYQTNGTQQFSYVSVNGERLSSSSGGEDDGQPANGALITVGGLGDSTDNPVDPMAPPTQPRSDDELYDLTPFVSDGDRSIEVATSNPSNDDNVMLATFTMNPPVTDIDTGNEVTVVALGDSFQSGEGAGNSIESVSDYYLHAYENGENYPQAVGGQQDTLTPEASGGNGCHRALANYPKLVSGYLTDSSLYGPSEVTLVDVTCSGATIQRGSKPPMVGDVSDGAVPGDIDADSQIAQAINRLATADLTADDVDVVTVGMGGNDAKFGDLVTACLIPNLARRLFDAYPDTPGSISWLVDRLSCWRLDVAKFKVGAAIDELAAKERFAQRKIRESFPNADIVQLDYPGVLPESSTSPSWCGGIGADDIAHADNQARRINDVIRDTVAAANAENAAIDRRYDLVEVGDAFGANALCPADPGDAFANGISVDDFDAEVARLLSDPLIRPRLDAASTAYSDYWRCVRRLFIACDPNDAIDRFTSNVQGLLDEMGNQQLTILANMTKSPASGESVVARYDRSRGLFHPNAEGVKVLACFVHNTLRYLGAWQCADGGNRLAASSGSSSELMASDAVGASRVPVPVSGPGTDVALDLGGYRPDSVVTVHHVGRQVAELVVGVDGRVAEVLTLPEGDPGVQVLEVRGLSGAGVGLGHDLRVTYPGAPALGSDYTVYVDGFEPRPDYVESTWTPEEVEVRYAGHLLQRSPVDPLGGLLVTVPVPEAWPTSGGLEIVVTGARSGVVRKVRLDPEAVARPTGLWATDGRLAFAGSDAHVGLLVHGESDVRLTGAHSRFTQQVEHVDDLDVARNITLDLAPEKVPAGETARPGLSVSDFRPGTTWALAAGDAYRAIPLSACLDGVWRVGADDLSGVIHVPCDVVVSGAEGTPSVTIAAEGSVVVEGPGIEVEPASGSGATVVAGGRIHVAGDAVRLLGTVHSAAAVHFSGADQLVTCGAVGSELRISGSGFTATTGTRCTSD